MADRIAFMVMPFGEKPTLQRQDGAPAVLDFDALWEHLYQPVLRDLKFQPVRADEDTNALIVVDMIKRLTLADVVVADVSIFNANVYYEVGVRHAAQELGCVLVAPDWSRQGFDIEQTRTVRFPLPGGELSAENLAVAKAALGTGIERLYRGRSPVHMAVDGYPDPRKLAAQREEAFRADVGMLTSCESAVRAVRATPDDGERRRLTQELVATYGDEKVVRESAVVELVQLLRDNVGWQSVLDYVNTLPAPLQRQSSVVEQTQLARAKVGDVAGSIAELETLIQRAGPTSERLGVLGGRHKQLMRQATNPHHRRGHLRDAIDAYERGMRLDLNDYYPSSNLPRLYRRRADAGDERRAAEAAIVADAACRASLQRDPGDEWARLTRLGAAFDQGDVAEARRHYERIAEKRYPDWMLRTTFADLAESLDTHPDEDVSTGLRQVLADLHALVPETGGAS
jgi:tetratricopeptide (TPR) repeat protein